MEVTNKYVKQFKLMLANKYKDDIPIRDLTLHLKFNDISIDESELERYIDIVVNSAMESYRNEITNNILKTIIGDRNGNKAC